MTRSRPSAAAAMISVAMTRVTDGSSRHRIVTLSGSSLATEPA